MSIVVSSLSKSYGQFTAVNSVSFTVNTGEIVGFLGPNGAGKSTTMKMLSGILQPTSGSAEINGFNILTEAESVKKNIGYLPENNPLYLDLTVKEYLEYSGEISGVTKDKINDRISEMLDICGLENMVNRLIGNLSKGYRQRVGLAQSLIHDPSVLILDEPTTGLDPNQILEIRDLIIRLGKEKTVLLSSHILQEVEAICNRVLIINDGVMVADGTPSELATKFQGGESYFLEFKGDLTSFQSLMQQTYSHVGQEVLATGNGKHKIRFTTQTEEDFNVSLYQFCAANQFELHQLYKEESNLEDIFRKLTASAIS